MKPRILIAILAIATLHAEPATVSFNPSGKLDLGASFKLPPPGDYTVGAVKSIQFGGNGWFRAVSSAKDGSLIPEFVTATSLAEPIVTKTEDGWQITFKPIPKTDEK